jgi:peptidoglycan hydrolase-like protein with peptidoglycan-binding domain
MKLKFAFLLAIIIAAVPLATARAQVLPSSTITAASSLSGCLPSSAPSIKILSPNGGEVFAVGTTMHIQWASCNISSSTAVNLQLLKQTTDASLNIPAYYGQALISLAVPNTGTYNWIIPSSIPNATMYLVSIDGSTRGQEGSGFRDISDNTFSINNGILSSTAVSPVALTAPIVSGCSVGAVFNSMTGARCSSTVLAPSPSPVEAVSSNPIYSCTVDLSAHSSDCSGSVSVIDSLTDQALVKVNFASPRKISQARFDVSFDTNAVSGWNVDIGDSNTNDGYGGDGATQSNDAEYQVQNGSDALYGNDTTTLSQTIDGLRGLYLGSNIDFRGKTLGIIVGDQTFTKGYGATIVGMSRRGSNLFALGGEADTEGQINYDIYAGFNRVISGNPSRIGTGVKKVVITLYGGSAPTPVLSGSATVSLPSITRPTPVVSSSVTASAAPTTISQNLSVGTRGDQVKALQQILVNVGLLTADNATGYFGNATLAAVKNLQIQKGLPAVGTVGPMTREVINKTAVPASVSSSASATPISIAPAPVVSSKTTSPVATAACPVFAYNVSYGLDTSGNQWGDVIPGVANKPLMSILVGDLAPNAIVPIPNLSVSIDTNVATTLSNVRITDANGNQLGTTVIPQITLPNSTVYTFTNLGSIQETAQGSGYVQLRADVSSNVIPKQSYLNIKVDDAQAPGSCFFPRMLPKSWFNKG